SGLSPHATGAQPPPRGATQPPPRGATQPPPRGATQPPPRGATQPAHQGGTLSPPGGGTVHAEDRDVLRDLAAQALYAALVHRGPGALLADPDDAPGATEHGGPLAGWMFVRAWTGRG